tara:strand:- start:213 stop:659 length:447 start_codon:yes stop_codon:yes gene_type:complete
MQKTFTSVIVATLLLLNLNLFGAKPYEWQTYMQNDSIMIEYVYQNCEYLEQFNSEYVLLKITNITNQDIIVKWEENLWIENKCINCETISSENRKQAKILAKSAKIGECNKNNSLRIFSKFTEDLEKMPGINSIISLSKFELVNIEIN